MRYATTLYRLGRSLCCAIGFLVSVEDFSSTCFSREGYNGNVPFLSQNFQEFNVQRTFNVQHSSFKFQEKITIIHFHIILVIYWVVPNVAQQIENTCPCDGSKKWEVS